MIFAHKETDQDQEQTLLLSAQLRTILHTYVYHYTSILDSLTAAMVQSNMFRTPSIDYDARTIVLRLKKSNIKKEISAHEAACYYTIINGIIKETYTSEEIQNIIAPYLSEELVSINDRIFSDMFPLQLLYNITICSSDSILIQL